jgi:hypothetical protein
MLQILQITFIISNSVKRVRVARSSVGSLASSAHLERGGGKEICIDVWVLNSLNLDQFV